MARTAAQDTLEKFRFLVQVALPTSAGTMVRLGFHDIQMPKRATNKVMYREGADLDINSISAGLSTMEDVVMSRGVIAGDGLTANDFLRWAEQVHTPSTGIADFTSTKSTSALLGSPGSNTYRAEVTIQMLNRSGVIVRVWRLYNAFPVNFVPGSDLNAGEDGDKSLEQLTLAYEDFQELSSTDSSTSLT